MNCLLLDFCLTLKQCKHADSLFPCINASSSNSFYSITHIYLTTRNIRKYVHVLLHELWHLLRISLLVCVPNNASKCLLSKATQLFKSSVYGTRNKWVKKVISSSIGVITTLAMFYKAIRMMLMGISTDNSDPLLDTAIFVEVSPWLVLFPG